MTTDHHDTFLRGLGQRRSRGTSVAEPEGEPSVTPVPTSEPLVAQGARTEAPPAQPVTPDQLLRRGRGQGRWTPIA